MTNEFDILREGRRLPGSIPATDYLSAIQSGGDLLATPLMKDINNPLGYPSDEIIKLVDDVADGGRPGRQAVKELLARAGSGDMNELLDVVNASLVLLIGLRYPRVVGAKEERFNAKLGIPAASRNMRDFVSDMFRGFSRNSVIYDIDYDQISTRAKMGFAQKLTQAVRTNFPEQDFLSLPQGFHELYTTLPDFIRAQGNLHYRFAFSPELSQAEAQTLNNFMENTDQNTPEVYAKIFTFLVKAWGNYHREPGLASMRGINVPFETGFEEDMIIGLNLLNGCLHNPDRAISNRALQILTEAGMGKAIRDGTERYFLSWPKAVQPYVEKMINGEPVSNEFRQAFGTLIQSVDERGRLIEMVPLIFIDYPSTEANIAQGNSAVDIRYNLLDKLASQEYSDHSLELLVKAVRERKANQVSKKALLELFDERRPLGFFLDNLTGRWQDLQSVTRDQMWPGFITARRAALWPSERELDILQFTGRHPASVLGFSGIQFHTRGFTPPEVGLEFTFKTSESKLRARIKEGQLVELPFDLEDTHPFIHAFLEHIAVGSFQELVTIATKRIGLVSEGGRKHGQDKVEVDTIHDEHLTSLPRQRVSYIRLTKYESDQLTSDEVVEETKNREHLSKAIPQSVVPLRYAVRYRYFRGLAEEARARGASDGEIRALEGQAIQNFALIPNPSAAKLEELPSEFALEAVDLPGGDRKYLDTWRVEHIRPKPKAGEEYNLPAIFERRYKAAPIALTQHLETWFTQPPVQQ